MGRFNDEKYFIDFVLVVQDDKGGSACMHGIEVSFGNFNLLGRRLKAFKQQLDFMWVATTTAHCDDLLRSLIDFDWVGVLVVEEEIKVLKEAALASPELSKGRRFATSLLVNEK